VLGGGQAERGDVLRDVVVAGQRQAVRDGLEPEAVGDSAPSSEPGTRDRSWRRWLYSELTKVMWNPLACSALARCSIGVTCPCAGCGISTACGGCASELIAVLRSPALMCATR
jgi:hypothetical protein